LQQFCLPKLKETTKLRQPSERLHVTVRAVKGWEHEDL